MLLCDDNDYALGCFDRPVIRHPLRKAPGFEATE